MWYGPSAKNIHQLHFYCVDLVYSIEKQAKAVTNSPVHTIS